MARTLIKNRKILLLIAIAFLCLSFFSSCSIGFLGTYYFEMEGLTYQTISFDIFNNAVLTTMIYENNELIGKTKLKLKWQRYTQPKKDSENNIIHDEKGNIVYEDSVYFIYYVEDNKRVTQFHYINNALVEVNYNIEFKTYRVFRR